MRKKPLGTIRHAARPPVAVARARIAAVPVTAARRLLLAGALLDRQPQRATPARVLSTVRGLGFVQIDSISSIERAHHLIMHTRLEGYHPKLLAHHTEVSRALFEHWTHDASLIRSDWLQWWTHRFQRDRARLGRNAWMRARIGVRWRSTLEAVRAQIDQRGPLGARDFPSPARAGQGWWDWSPHKAALEMLWRSGELAVHSRRNFEKVYERADRVLGPQPALPDRQELVEWACMQALQRLGAATPRELSGFMNMVTIAEARAWSARAAREGRIQAAMLARLGRAAMPGVARLDWRERAAAVQAPALARALAPFDPLVRDRARLSQLFGFEFRFEAFVPAAKRVHGYYTMPVLQGERFIGRIDARADRAAGRLLVQRTWCESPGRAAAQRRSIHAACERLAAQLGLACAIA